jgi:hypothetical protein
VTGRRLLPAALGAAALLAGCPLPQPLPNVPTEAVTPPRIMMDAIVPSDTIVHLPAGCTTPPSVLLQASVENPTEFPGEARWFVDYDPTDPNRIHWKQHRTIQPTTSQSGSLAPQDVGPFDFVTAPGETAGTVHVIELVVSNGFDPALAANGSGDPGEGAVPPYKGTQPNFESQTYRWVFLLVPQSATAQCP